MKRTFVLVFAFIFILALSFPVFSQETELYESITMGFTIDYPSSWIVSDTEYNQVSFFSSQEIESEDAPGGVFMIMSLPISVIDTDDLYLAFEMASAEFRSDEENVFGLVEETEIAGMPALSQTIEVPEESVLGKITGFLSIGTLSSCNHQLITRPCHTLPLGLDTSSNRPFLANAFTVAM